MVTTTIEIYIYIISPAARYVIKYTKESGARAAWIKRGTAEEVLLRTVFPHSLARLELYG